MEFIKQRNHNLPAKFRKIAVEYMRHGEDLKIRWDQAFFQMLVETNYLKYGRDVSASQNNFAGLGATGGGEPGESFRTVSDGVKAHLQHVLMYAGKHIDNPVAERTRKVQEWGILDKWRKRLGRPLTFTDLTRKWSPGDRGYSRDIKVTASRFHKRFCNAPDPHPEWIAEARGQSRKRTRTAAVTKQKNRRNYALEAIERGKREQISTAAGLGGSGLKQAGSLPFKILNPTDNRNTADNRPAGQAADNTTKTAMVVPNALPEGAAPGASKPKVKCNVFTASYGGEKAMIIRAEANGVINYTVLDVNKGREQRETEAYIAAYARGGTTIGAFDSPAQALDQAFKLCPEN